jgi:succinyl-CoA synthetase alpha subunit
MSVLVDKSSRILVQGITGRQGSLHTQLILEYGSQVVAGVTPGKGGEQIHGVPVFDTVQEACERAHPNVTVIFVPAMWTLEAVQEAADAAMPLIVVITEHVPVLDTMRMRAIVKKAGVQMVGPNSIGVISPGKCKVGIMPGMLYSPGRVGVISRSGTLSHETASLLMERGLGLSTSIGMGGDPIHGIGFEGGLRLFAEDEETDLIVILGEIGGGAEERAAAYLRGNGYPKPVLAFVAGRTAPPEKRMGHAGAIIREGEGTAKEKIAAFENAGVVVAQSLRELIDLVEDKIK